MTRAMFIVLTVLGCSAVAEEPQRVELNFGAGVVLPGEEELRCVEVVSPDRDIFVSAFSVTKQQIHHVNVWLEPGRNIADPGVFGCPAADEGSFLFDDSFREPSESVLPGVILIPRRSVVRARCHVLNVTQTEAPAGIGVVLSGGSPDAQRLYGVALSPAPPVLPDIPAGARLTVTFQAPPAGLTLYNLFGHQHAHGTVETLTLNEVEVYRSTDWAEPVVRQAPLEVTPADYLRWSCVVANTSTGPLTWGQNSVTKSEMCAVFGLATEEWVVDGRVL